MSIKWQDSALVQGSWKEMYKGGQLDQCYFRAANKANDVDICDGIKDDDKRDSCYFNVIFVTKEFGECKKIVNVGFRETCDGLP